MATHKAERRYNESADKEQEVTDARSRQLRFVRFRSQLSFEGVSLQRCLESRRSELTKNACAPAQLIGHETKKKTK